MAERVVLITGAGQRLGAAMAARLMDEGCYVLVHVRSSLDEAKANLSMREFELERARASLIDTSAARGSRHECDCVEVVAPVSGQVLRVLQRSEGVIASLQHGSFAVGIWWSWLREIRAVRLEPRAAVRVAWYQKAPSSQPRPPS